MLIRGNPNESTEEMKGKRNVIMKDMTKPLTILPQYT
jgi:hypothetical protein